MSTFFFLLRRALGKMETHPFPFPHMPDNLTEALMAVQGGTMDIHAPSETPERLLGRLAHSRSRCKGCGACIAVCPCGAVTLSDEAGKIDVDLARCCLCLQCVEACPLSALSVSDEFLFSATDREGLHPPDEEPRQPRDERDLWALGEDRP